MRGYPQFPFSIPIAVAKISFFRIVINCAKIPLYKKEPSLNYRWLIIQRKRKESKVLKKTCLSLFYSLKAQNFAFGDHALNKMSKYLTRFRRNVIFLCRKLGFNDLAAIYQDNRLAERL